MSKHTLVIMDPWVNPRPPTRIWCLFEMFETTRCGGRLQVLLDPKQDREMSLSLFNKFDKVFHMVHNIDVEFANATVNSDIGNILGAIKDAPDGINQLNAEARRQTLLWLADKAAAHLERTDPELHGPRSPAELVAELGAGGEYGSCTANAMALASWYDHSPGSAYCWGSAAIIFLLLTAGAAFVGPWLVEMEEPERGKSRETGYIIFGVRFVSWVWAPRPH